MLGGASRQQQSFTSCVMSSNFSHSDNICNFFDRGKYCRYGNRCKFLHIRSSDITERSSCNSKQERDLEAVGEGVAACAISVPTSVQQDEVQQPKLCYYFSKFNRCKYGKGCRFEHIRDEAAASKHPKSVKKGDKDNVENQDKNNIPSENEEKEEVETQAEGKEENAKKQRPKRVCRYFRAGHCSMGDSCRFRHPEQLVTRNDSNKDGPSGDDKIEKKRPSPPQRKYQPRGRVNIYVLEELSEEDLVKSRSDEIAQLKKRYPKSEENIKEDGTTQIQFIFVPSDPDWV